MAANEVNEVSDKINIMIKPCTTVFDICRKTFCKTRQEEEDFVIFMFMNIRSLYESQMQRKIDKWQGAWVPFVVMDGITKIIEKGSEDLIAEFSKEFKPKNE